MARLENDLGVQSTFYVMARSPYYNIHSHAAAKQLDRIIELGHTLGIHVDLNEPRDSTITPTMAAGVALQDHALLTEQFPVSDRMSLHCPPYALLWAEIPGFDYAYSPQWRDRYYADSEGVFVYGDPEDAEVRPLQVNLHPMHWFESGDDYGAFWR